MTTTTPTGTARPTAAVVELRPGLTVRARRAAELYAAFVARRAAEPHHEPLLDVVVHVLARADRVAGSGHSIFATSWDRMLRLLDDQQEAHHATPTLAASANLVGLAVFGDPLDHLALADLAELLGHERLARLQHRHGQQLEADSSLPITTQAVRRMLGEGLRERLLADPLTAERADVIDDACLRAAHALLLQGIDHGCPSPEVESVDEFVDIAEHGTVTEWRHLMGLAAESAWSPYAVRVAELAQAAGHQHAASVVAALIDLCREQQQEAERDTVAREIGRLVALSGVPESEFATWMGTTASHLSTYASGTATPSAAIMLRISRTSLALQRRAAVEAALGGRKLLSVQGGRASRAVG